MKVSVITAVLNDKQVGRALESALSQQFDGELELIVVDGGSTDGTLEVLEWYRPYLAVFISDPDRGLYDALNKGIARATGEVVGTLHADDYYNDPFVLHDVVMAFQDREVQACYGDLVYVDGENKVVRYWRSGALRPWKFYLGWIPPHPTFFVRKSLYERYGAFDLRFPIAADYELMLRFLLKYRVRTRYIPRVLVRMSIGGQSNRSIANIVRGNKEAFLSWRCNRLAFGYLVPLLKPASKIPQFIRRLPFGIDEPSREGPL